MENILNRYLTCFFWLVSLGLLISTRFSSWQQPGYWQEWQPGTADLLFSLWVLLFADVVITKRGIRKTEKRLAELTAENDWLKENKALQDSLSAATKEILWQADLNNGNVSYVNVYLEDVLGYSQEDVNADKHWWENNLHPYDKDAIIQKFNTAIENGDKFCQAEYRFRCKDGSYKFILDSSHIARDDAGAAKRIIGSMVDITGYKNLQTMMVMQKMDHEMEMKRAITETQDAERHRLSEELHDNINQLMLSARLFVNYALTKWNTRAEERKLLDSISETITQAFDEIRSLSHRLNNSWIEKNNLVESVNELCNRMARISNYHVQVNASGFDPGVLNSHQNRTIYRIIQEQLSNIAKHANASVVNVNLLHVSRQVQVEIIDNGKGFDTTNACKGIGLMNIQHRVESCQGELFITSKIGAGTHLKAIFRPAFREKENESPVPVNANDDDSKSF